MTESEGRVIERAMLPRRRHEFPHVSCPWGGTVQPPMRSCAARVFVTIPVANLVFLQLWGRDLCSWRCVPRAPCSAIGAMDPPFLGGGVHMMACFREFPGPRFRSPLRSLPLAISWIWILCISTAGLGDCEIALRLRLFPTLGALESRRVSETEIGRGDRQTFVNLDCSLCSWFQFARWHRRANCAVSEQVRDA